MSIYSGFATRQQEQAYDNLLLYLIDVLQRRIIKFYIGQEADEHKFHTILNSIQHHLLKMEHSKYLQPKFGSSFKPLLDVTTSIVSNCQPSSSKSQQIKNVPLDQQSLSFSRDKMSDNLKGWSFGKIKHQLINEPKEDSAWLKGFTNPEEQSTEQEVKRIASSYVPKSYRSKKWADKMIRDQSDIKLALENQEKKNAQYMIREYVGRGRSQRISKKKSVVS